MTVKTNIWAVGVMTRDRVTEEELEPLDSPPPAPLILCCEWIAMKICGYSPPDKEESIISETGGKTNRWEYTHQYNTKQQQ